MNTENKITNLSSILCQEPGIRTKYCWKTEALGKTKFKHHNNS